MTTRLNPPFWIGDRLFSREDLDLILWTVDRFKHLSRTELAYTICENIEWKAPNGKERLHGCLDLLEKLEADGMVKLPKKRLLSPYKKRASTTAPLPGLPFKGPLNSLGPVTVEPVPPEEQSLWDATVAAHHPLGFRKAFGAHQRYWIRGHVEGRKRVLGAFLFAAPARNVTVREGSR